MEQRAVGGKDYVFRFFYQADNGKAKKGKNWRSTDTDRPLEKIESNHIQIGVESK